ncbi:MAG TPA: cupin domain-containing protein [Rhodopila sp.]|jgi:uncharacterized protein YjlB
MTEPLTFTFDDDGAIPNSHWPLLVYRDVVPADAAEIERLFAANHWPPAWRDGVHPFHHFHSSAHEALGVARGEASVLFGGPRGKVLTVRAGDVVVIPAGVAHCNQGQSGDLLIVGAYPDNSDGPDLRRGKPDEHDAAQRAIDAVPLPPADPVAGGTGSLAQLWAGMSKAPR